MQDNFNKLKELNVEIRKILTSKDVDAYLNTLSISEREELVEVFSIGVNNSIILTNKINKNEGK